MTSKLATAGSVIWVDIALPSMGAPKRRMVAKEFYAPKLF